MSYGEFLPSTKYLAVYHLADGDNANGNAAYDLTLSNTTVVDGKFGSALKTSSNNGVITWTGTCGITPTTGFTYHLWYKHVSSGEYTTGSYILTHGINKAYNQAACLIWAENTSTITWDWNVAGVAISSWTMNTTSFDLYSMTWANGGLGSFYVNGKFLGSKSGTPAGTSTATERFNLGSYLWDPPRRRYVNGIFDECIIEARPWTYQEIKLYYEQAKGRINPRII